VLRAERDENEMKNIQVVDGALNCVYDIFQASDDDFAQISGNESDIAFGEDFQGRDDLLPVFERVWRGRVPKVQAQGIHGMYFVGLELKKAYYPTRRDEEAVNPDGTRLR
jgi:hypothetical protein